MRIPFTYTVLQQLIEKLKAAKLPGVTVDELGLTPEKRKLQIIRVTDPTSKLPVEQRFGNLLIAREHSSENASSIMLLGALNCLLQPGVEAQALRKDTTWSFILIEDPDGSTSVQFDRLTDQFADYQSPTWPPEALLWTSGLSEQYYAGKLMDVVVSLHNIEANESPSNVFCPFIDSRFTATVEGINTQFFTRVKAQGMQTGEANKPWSTGVMNSRLFGWCSRQYGSLPLNYEVNDRYPANRLTLKKTMDIGAAMVQALRAWEITPDGQKWHKDRQEIRQRRIAARDGYYTRVGHTKDQRTAKDILIKGF